MDELPIIVSEIPPRRQSSGLSFFSKMGEKSESGNSSNSLELDTSMNSTKRSFTQTFIEDWLTKTSQKSMHTSASDLPPWASPRKIENSKAEIIEEEEDGLSDNSITNIIDQVEREQSAMKESNNDDVTSYSIMADNLNFLDDIQDTAPVEEDKVTSYTSANSTFSPHDYSDDQSSTDSALYRPHLDPGYYNTEYVHNENHTIPYNNDLDDDNSLPDTIPYKSDNENSLPDTLPYKSNYDGDDYPDTLPYKDPDDDKESLPSTIPYLSDRETDIMPCSFGNNDNTPIDELIENYETQSDPLVDALDLNLIPDDSVLSSQSSKQQITKDDDDVDFFDAVTEEEIIELERMAVMKSEKNTGKRKITSPLLVAVENPLVRVEKKQLRSSLNKKPTTIDDYFSFTTGLRQDIETDIGKESEIPSFTLSSNEDIKKSQTLSQENRRKPRLGISKRSFLKD